MNRVVLKQFAVRSYQQFIQTIRPLVGTRQEAEHFAQLWFMRLTALRFMEANGYLPRKSRLFLGRDNAPLLPREEPRLRRRLESLCAALGKVPALSGMFGEDAMEMLPQDLLAHDGMISEMIRRIPTEEWLDFPEILGWLYQYCNTDERERTNEKLRSNIKIPTEQIPAATQMFTPDWIVRYMTQNALSTLCQPHENWAFFLPEAEQSETVNDALHRLFPQGRKPSEITVIDPCMGTGHILAYVFDALMDLYLREGYSAEQAAVSILKRNLYGLDIDENACDLAKFVLLMKARRYHDGILKRSIHLHLLHFAGLECGEGAYPPSYMEFAEQFTHAETFGSLLHPKNRKLPPDAPPTLIRMQKLCRMLSRTYDAVITNPPYMGSSSMNTELRTFVQAQYPDSKSDLFAAFMERCAAMTASHGCFAMITQHAWMFLSSYAQLRRKMQAFTMRSMVHLGAKAFSSTDVGTIVQTTAFVCMGNHVPQYRTTYLRLTEDEDKERAFFESGRRYICNAEQFSEISGSPICYWASEQMRQLFKEKKLASLCTICQGMTTSDNKRFLRLWHEVARENIAFGCENAQAAMASEKRWFPYNKGGRFRKWYGNNSYVVDFYRNGEEMRAFHAEISKMHSGGRIKNERMYFLPAVTWPFITESTKFGVRFQPKGFLFDVSGSSLFPEPSEMLYIMGFLSSRVALEILRLFNPTMNFQVENIGSLPMRFDGAQKPLIEQLVLQNIAIAREEWDSYEQSWDFRTHPFIQEGVTRLSEAFGIWEQNCRRRLQTMQNNERRLNEIFIRIYGLEGELSAEVPESEITLRSADLQADVRSFLSFAVGCMFGRYRVNAEFPPLSENFLPVSPDCGTDAALYVEAFLTAVYGAETLEENLQFLAKGLGSDAAPRAALRRYFAMEFYADHCRTYRKRPIYWMADSGRQHALRGLMYLHRLDAQMYPILVKHTQRRMPYLSNQTRLLEEAIPITEGKTALRQLQRKLTNAQEAQSELTEFLSELDRLQKDGTELVTDDGVKRNYDRFQRILARIY